ncbi:hypothetical protein [Actinoplanes friuliensis]|nr:hypothetical protein [Actinoplanes friuliensis]
MNRTRRTALMAAAVMAATGLTTVTATAPAAASHREPRPVTKWIKPVEAHEPTWVKVYWKTGKKICDAAVTVEGTDVGIVYPSNTDTYTSFLNDAELKPGRPDYTAFRVRADRNRTTVVRLAATLTYNTCGDEAVEKSRTYRLRLPVLRNYDYDN